MKTLIVFYSRTGCTRTAAREVGRLLGADLEELRETVDRSGAGGYLRAGRDAMCKRTSELLPTTRRPEAYDLTILATPVWAFTVCPAVRTWMMREAGNLKNVAFLCTQGGSGAERTQAEMAEITGKTPVARLVLRDRDIRAAACASACEGFADECRKSLVPG